MVINEDDENEIIRHKKKLLEEFKVKDPRKLKYFLGVKFTRSKEGLVMNHKKYGFVKKN